MNFQQTRKIIRENFFFYLTGFLILLGIKYFYSKAGSDELKWILAPTTWWVEALSGIPFEYEPGAGYVNKSLRFLIAPSCSGVQFMIITIGMLLFSFVHRIGSLGILQDTLTPKHTPCDIHHASARLIAHRNQTGTQRYSPILPRICWIPFCVLLSYPLTVFINGLRIILAIYLPGFLGRLGLYGGFLTHDRLHTIIGITIYFISLLVIYRLADSILPGGTACGKAKPARKFLPPLFWYFSIALGVPFLNRAYRKNSGQFSEYATLIISVCAVILILYCLISFLRKLLAKTCA